MENYNDLITISSMYDIYFDGSLNQILDYWLIFSINNYMCIIYRNNSLTHLDLHILTLRVKYLFSSPSSLSPKK